MQYKVTFCFFRMELYALFVVVFCFYCYFLILFLVLFSRIFAQLFFFLFCFLSCFSGGGEVQFRIFETCSNKLKLHFAFFIWSCVQKTIEQITYIITYALHTLFVVDFCFYCYFLVLFLVLFSRNLVQLFIFLFVFCIVFLEGGGL